jgi:hypothetical protein
LSYLVFVRFRSCRVCFGLFRVNLVRNWCGEETFSGLGIVHQIVALDLLTLNQRVLGSSPGAPTKPFKNLEGYPNSPARALETELKAANQGRTVSPR